MEWSNPPQSLWDDPFLSSCCLPSESSSSAAQLTEWTSFENMLLENVLADELDLDNEDNYEKISLKSSGNTIEQIQEPYEALVEDVENIESGCNPIPDYVTREELPNDSDCLVRPQPASRKGLSSSARRKSTNLGRRKAVPWTEDEHRLFLMGLNKYGKGNWKSISRIYVVTKTPAQVASHAQKYFLRLKNLGIRESRRWSINDIRTFDIIAKPTLSVYTNYKPISSSSPAFSSFNLPRMTSTASIYPPSKASGQPTMSNRQSFASPPLFSGRPALYEHGRENMNYNSWNELINSCPSNTLTGSIPFNSYPCP